MKRIVYALAAVMVSAILASCTNENKIVDVAEKYVSEQLCPLLPNAKVSEKAGMPQPIDKEVRKIKDKAKQQMLINSQTKRMIDSKMSYTSDLDNPEKLKNNLTLLAIKESTIKALEEANSDEGFYIVEKRIDYGNEGEYVYCDIIVSKSLNVLNKPIDISKVDSTYKNITNY